MQNSFIVKTNYYNCNFIYLGRLIFFQAHHEHVESNEKQPQNFKPLVSHYFEDKRLRPPLYEIGKLFEFLKKNKYDETAKILFF